MNSLTELQIEGLASSKEELAAKLQNLLRPLTVQELEGILNTTVKYDGPNKVICFLAGLLTYTMDEQINVAFLAESSTGKSYIPLEISWYFPKEDVLKIAYASPTSFFHETGQIEKVESFDGTKHVRIHVNLERKLLIFLDMPHAKLLERLRPLLSHDEKQIECKITDKSERHGMRTKTVIINGFPTVIFCSVNQNLDEQEKTRLFILSPETSQQKLEAALFLKLLKESDKEAFQRYMECEPSRVFLRARVEAIKSARIKHIIIPNDLRDLILKKFTEKRKWLLPRHLRDITRLLALIKAFALLNYAHRQKVGDSIAVNAEDVEVGFQLYEAISEPNEMGVSPEQWEIYKAMRSEDSEGNGFTILEFQQFYMKKFHKPLGYERAKLILKDLCGAGLLAEVPNEKDRRQNKYMVLECGVQPASPLLGNGPYISSFQENNLEKSSVSEKEFEKNRLEEWGNNSTPPSSSIYFHGEPEASEGAVSPIGPGEPAEKCELCGLRAVEWKVYFGGRWLKRCSSCLEKMRALGLKLHYQPLTEGETNNET
jgi:hypothetical protein